MDFNPETVHSVLVDMELPVSIEDCRTPTETFVVNIITEFFHQFYLDVARIKKVSNN